MNFLFFLSFVKIHTVFLNSRVMQAAIDATDVDRGPIVNNQIEVALYFILFVVIFSFFFINIFVALIILTFQDEKEKEQGDCELERNQVRPTLHQPFPKCFLLLLRGPLRAIETLTIHSCTP
jgi:hypothetical protein